MLTQQILPHVILSYPRPPGPAPLRRERGIPVVYVWAEPVMGQAPPKVQKEERLTHAVARSSDGLATNRHIRSRTRLQPSCGAVLFASSPPFSRYHSRAFFPDATSAEAKRTFGNVALRSLTACARSCKYAVKLSSL